LSIRNLLLKIHFPNIDMLYIFMKHFLQDIHKIIKNQKIINKYQIINIHKKTHKKEKRTYEN